MTGKELFRISRRYQLAYKCRISEIDDGSEFHICANNFRVDQEPVQPFEDESMATACANPDPETDNNKEARGSNENASNSIGQGANQEDIAELQRQGVEVENEDCLPENLPTSENKNQIPGCMGNGLPQLLVQASVMQSGDGKTTVGVRYLKYRSSICYGCASQISISGRLLSR